ANDRRDVCRTRGPWGHDTGACFQLRNHGGPHRRHYHEAIEPRWIGNLGAPSCPFRELNQPMRNVALARSLVERGEADRAIVALCAPLGNTNVWRQRRLSQALFERVPRVDLVDLPVGRVAESLDDERRSWLMERYGEEALT